MAVTGLLSLSVIGFILLISGIIYIAGLDFKFYLPTDDCYPNAGTTGCPYGANESLIANVLIWLGLAMFVAFGGAGAMLAVIMKSVGNIAGAGMFMGAESINMATYPIGGRERTMHKHKAMKKHKANKARKMR